MPVFCDWLRLQCDTETPTTLEFRCLSCMLDCDKNRGLVTAEAFARLVKCIGPFIDGGEIIDQVKCLIEAPCVINSFLISYYVA